MQLEEPGEITLPRSPSQQEVVSAVTDLLGGMGRDSLKIPNWAAEWLLEVLSVICAQEMEVSREAVREAAEQDMLILSIKSGKRAAKFMFILGRLAVEQGWDVSLVSTREE